MIGPGSVQSWAQAIELAFARACVEAAQSAVLTLLGALGQSTEPDFAGLAPAYDRMLAIGLLLVVFFASMAGRQRHQRRRRGFVRWFEKPALSDPPSWYSTIASVVGYLESYAALLATAVDARFPRPECAPRAGSHPHLRRGLRSAS